MQDDSIDVESWKAKLSVWKREELLRQQQEEDARIKMENRRREFEERRESELKQRSPSPSIKRRMKET